MRLFNCEEKMEKETAIERVTREIEKINAFIGLLNVAEKQNCDLITLLKRVDDEQQDILHEFELDTFHRSEGHKKARRLKEIRQIRCFLKDTIALWMPIKEFAKDHKNIKFSLMKVVSDIENVINEQNTRTYIPRVDKNSSIAGQHYEPLRLDVDIANKKIK